MCIKNIILLFFILGFVSSKQCDLDANRINDCYNNPPYPPGPWQRYTYQSITVNKNVLCVTYYALWGKPIQCISFNCKDEICHNGEYGWGAKIFIC